MTPGDSILDHALAYTAKRMAPLPVHGVNDDGSCTCSQGLACGSAGKHPVENRWSKLATLNPEDVRKRFAGHRGNIGLQTGIEGLLLIEGDGGDAAGQLTTLASLAGLEAMPDTMSAVSGSGVGIHLVYRLRPGWTLGNAAGVHGLAIDVRGTGGQFVVAPSRHRSGNQYRWTNGLEPNALPEELYALLTAWQNRSTTSAIVPGQPLTADQRAAKIKRTRGSLDKRAQAIQGEKGQSWMMGACALLRASGLDWDDCWELASEYNARAVPPFAEDELKRKLEEGFTHGRRGWLPERERPNAPAVTGDDLAAWREACRFEDKKDGTKVLKNCMGTWSGTLQHHPAWRGKIRWDTFSQKIHVTNPPWPISAAKELASEYWRNSDATRMRDWFERNLNLTLPRDEPIQAVEMVAESNAFHSGREWLSGLQWDGVRRAGHWLPAYMGVEGDLYSRTVGQWWLVAGAARLMKPGCKVDSALILQGKQGLGKSTAFGVLSGRLSWYTESPLPIGEHDINAALMLQGKHIVEFAELDTMWKSRNKAMRAFLTRASDDIVPKHKNFSVDMPRNCIFAGTTNEQEFLLDPEGSRRFWPVVCHGVKINELRRDRDQLWAEALILWRNGAKWWPDTAAEIAMCEEKASVHRVSEEWADPINKWLAGGMGGNSDVLTTVEIATGALGMFAGQVDKRASLRIGQVMRENGWKYQAVRRNGAVSKAWKRQQSDGCEI